MRDKINQLEEQYIQIISNIYPGIGTFWGNANGKFTDISKLGTEKAIESLKKIRMKCNELSNVDHLKSNIDMRLFELTVLRKNVLTAYYLYDITLDTLLILWDDFVILKYGLNESILRERLINIIPLIDIMIEEMCQREFSYLDIVCTEAAIKGAIKVLQEKKKEYENMLSLFVEVEKKCLEFLNFVTNLKMSVDDINKLYTYGPDIMLQYIKIKSNWEIDASNINSIYNEAIKNLNRITLKKNLGNKKCSVNIISSLIDEIYEETKNFFGEMPDLQDNLRIIEFDYKKRINNAFYYVNDMEDGKVIGYLFFSSNYRYESTEQLKLKLVHEIYPGHHYMMNIISKHSYSKNKYRLWKNDIVSEGWAKYCEYYYSKNYCKNKYFDNNLALMALMFIIIMDIYYYGRPLKEVIQRAKKLSKLDSRYVKILVINAFRDWENHLNYYLGFNYFKKQKDITFEQLIH